MHTWYEVYYFNIMLGDYVTGTITDNKDEAIMKADELTKENPASSVCIVTMTRSVEYV